MTLKVVTMAELRLEVLLEAERTGLTVSEVCRRYGISRQTYYLAHPDLGNTSAGALLLDPPSGGFEGPL